MLVNEKDEFCCLGVVCNTTDWEEKWNVERIEKILLDKDIEDILLKGMIDEQV